MGIRFEVQNLATVRAKMRAATAAITGAAEDGQKDTAEEILDEVIDTSPVRTGRYKSNWDLVEAGDTVYIYNDTPYGKYLVFPNSHMVGSPKADVPSRGIIHNVRGIIQKHKSTYKNNMTKRIRGVLESF